MAAIGALNTAQTATSAQSAQAAAQAAAQAKVQQLGLPPVALSAAASANTLNASLATSQWGVDPASVAGVYGGAATQSGGLFSSDYLLPLLTNLTHANAEQALSLLGISTPKAKTAGTAAAAVSAAATPTANELATDQAASPSGAMNVDPLWGRTS